MMTNETAFLPTSENNQPLVADLGHFSTFKALNESAAYGKHKPTLDKLFNTPRLYQSADAKPRLQAFLRIAVWNIERGSRLEGIIETLNHHPILQYADLLLLNELDDGMIRSRNLNVALELSRAISAHAIFGVEYLEFTKGTGDELNLAGENLAALHGNAILTRHNFSAPRLVRLARCENNFESAEKRIGGRLAILAQIHVGEVDLLATTAHLDVVNTPRCRAKQLRDVVAGINREVAATSTGSQKVILGGDFNTHTFARGGRFRTLKNVARIFGLNPERLKRGLMKKEVAIKELEQSGFDIDLFNDGQPTSYSIVSALQDKSSLPAPVRWWTMRRVGAEGLKLEFRLDWLAARGIRALQDGEIVDATTGVKSISRQTIKNLSHAGLPLSDHDPIVVDIALH
jgi:endonuclease/exonuclease/phosphatase family metal-dependent hydrolase